jgi:phosphoserine phosphatase
MKKILTISITAIIAAIAVWHFTKTPTCEYVANWNDATNARICEFIKTAEPINGRRVAVFDVDGTLITQVPFYLADEALMAGLPDSETRAKYAAAQNATTDDNLIRTQFLAGKTPKQVDELGTKIFDEMKFKSYPEMQTLVKNLKNFGWEIYTISCSPQDMYRGIVAREFGVNTDNVWGTRAEIDEHGIRTATRTLDTCYEGKAELVRNEIGIAPQMVGGNSGGDYAMLQTATGMKIIVNGSDKFNDRFANDETAVFVTSPDTDDGRKMLSREYGIKPNVIRQ